MLARLYESDADLYTSRNLWKRNGGLAEERTDLAMDHDDNAVTEVTKVSSLQGIATPTCI
jgi:hypothetical protein